MINVEQKIKGKKLILEIDLEERHGPSKSGKTTIVGSSEGNQIIPYEGAPEDEEMFLGLNCYTKKIKKKK
jgi:hypothetical protein